MALCEHCRKVDFNDTGLLLSLSRRSGFRNVTVSWADILGNRQICLFCAQNHDAIMARLLDTAEPCTIQSGKVVVSQHRQPQISAGAGAMDINYNCLKVQATLACTNKSSPNGYGANVVVYHHRVDTDRAHLDINSILRDFHRGWKYHSWAHRIDYRFRDRNRHSTGIQLDDETRKPVETKYVNPDSRWDKQLYLALAKPVSNVIEATLGHVSAQDMHISLARVRPLLMDTSLLKKWKTSCLSQHKQEIGAKRSLSFSVLRVIDVQKKCVVDCAMPANWVALSYVWGLSNNLTLTTKSMDELGKEGVLTEDTVPKTIYDAMTVTAASNEKYLWVDALCIIQDDANDKLIWIPCMGEIYTQSIFTIVARSGTGANSGLPGLRPGSRIEEQRPFEVEGTRLVTSLMHTRVQSDPPEAHDPVRFTRDWADRGWTMQEYILAPRKVIFTKEKVLWQCRQATWCEESRRDECGNLLLREPDDTDMHTVWAEDTRRHEGQMIVVTAYQALVDEYSTRALTYESDRLNAFLGILQTFESLYKLETLWALPKDYFGYALTWTSTEAAQPTRRTTLCPYRYEEEVIECPFPSWSWLGYTDAVENPATHYRVFFQALKLVFYTVNRDRTATSAIPGPQGLYGHQHKDQILAPSWYNADQRHLEAADFPVDIAKRNLWAVMLGIWTSVAIADLLVGTTSLLFLSDDQPDAHRLYGPESGNQLDLKFLQLQDATMKPGSRQGVKLILVRYTTDASKHEAATAFICNQKEDEDGVYERRGILEMDGRIWASLSLSWHKIFLV